MRPRVRSLHPGPTAGPAGCLTAALLATAAGCGWLSRTDNAQGVRLYQQGNYLGAVNAFQQALARQPGNPDTFYNLGATYHQQAKLFGRDADLATAERYYDLCLARNLNHDACQRALAVLLVEEERPAEADARLRSWAAAQPANPAPHVELARLAQERGDLAAAERHLAGALAIDPANGRALVALGSVRESTGDPSGAAAAYARALAIDPRQPAVAARLSGLQAPQASVQRTAALPAPQASGAPAPAGNAGR